MSAAAAVELAILVGLQGAGKSTYYASHLAATHLLVSKDRLGGSRDRQRRQILEIDRALAAGRSVAVDNTNPSAADRRPLIELGRGHGATIVGIFIDAPLGDCLVRNRQREGRARVPDVALYTTARRLEPPSWPEGFDELWHVLPEPVARTWRIAAIPRSPGTPVPS